MEPIQVTEPGGQPLQLSFEQALLMQNAFRIAKSHAFDDPDKFMEMCEGDRTATTNNITKEMLTLCFKELKRRFLANMEAIGI